MKLFHLLFALTLIICFSSCGDDEMPMDTMEEPSIAGTYEVSSLTTTACNDDVNNGSLTFNSDGTGNLGGLVVQRTGLLNLSDDGKMTNTTKITLIITEEDLVSINTTGTYIANGNTITLCSPDCSDFSIEGNSIIYTENTISTGCSNRLTYTKN